MSDARAPVLHAISRDHKWSFECVDCRGLTDLDVRFQNADKAIDAHNVKVAEADLAHADEPMPRAPHEGDYYRGLRDGLMFFVDPD